MNTYEEYMIGTPIWTALCECAEHKDLPWIRVSKQTAWETAEAIGANIFTEAGAKALGHAIMTLGA